jgi:hypothetical protein
MFEAEAWDPAIGTNNGDGITSVSFTISNSLGAIIYSYADSTSNYCVFKGDGPCKDAEKEGMPLKADTYTIEATVLTIAGETKTVTRTFVVPAITHLEIIFPDSDGFVVTNPNDTKFEAEAWDSTVGLYNGDGITSVTFVIYDSLLNPIYTYVDTAPFYCAFGGDSSCGNAASAGVNLPADNYTLEATVLTDASETITVKRTFTIP